MAEHNTQRGEPAKPWLLVFDLDGTLINSSLDLCLSVNAAMAHVGAPQLPHELITGYIGDGAAMLVRRALGDPGDLDSSADHRQQHQEVFERAFAYFLEYYREHKLDNTHPYEGTLAALEAIRSRNPRLPMAVLTNKPVHPSQEICDALQISPFLFANYGGNSFETKKPDPTGLQTLMAEARQLWSQQGVHDDALTAQGVVMVGDSEVDVLTARRAGARSLGCRYGLSPHTLQLTKPDLLCDRPQEWPGLLGL
jgi:phosphoglycolate phosphatase